MRRLIIVYNPNSSQYIHVKEEILSHVTDFKGFLVGKFAIEKASFESNVARLAEFLKEGDLVLAAGGDATAAITANAIMSSKKDATLAVLPYGNFNDLARTLGTMKLDDVKQFSSVAKLYPLAITVNGHFWRYATCYVTMGMTAEAVELFDDPKFRKKLQKGRKSSWRSYLALVKWYFKFRHSKVFIPPFTISGVPCAKNASDYCALSGKSMCRIMKGGYDFLKPKTFRSMNWNLTRFWAISILMLKSIFARTPGTDTKGDLIEFIDPATVKLQAEGEYQTFKGAKTIEVKKSPTPIKVIIKK